MGTYWNFVLQDRAIVALLACETALAVQSERTTPGTPGHWVTLSAYVLLGFVATTLILARLRVAHGGSELTRDEKLKLGLKSTLLFLVIVVAVMALIALLVGAGAGVFFATTKMNPEEATKYAPYFVLVFMVPILFTTWWLYLMMALAFFTANGKSLAGRSLRLITRNARVFLPILGFLCAWGLLKPVLRWALPGADFGLRLSFAVADLYCYQLVVFGLMFAKLRQLPETELLSQSP